VEVAPVERCKHAKSPLRRGLRDQDEMSDNWKLNRAMGIGKKELDINVVQGFVYRQENVIAHVGRQWDVRSHLGNLHLASNARGVQIIAGVLTQMIEQCGQVVIAGIDGPKQFVQGGHPMRDPAGYSGMRAYS